MSELVTIADYTENSYKTVIPSATWRAAYLNNTADRPAAVTYLERHTTSDELFVLVQGSCKMVLSADGCSNFEIIDMEPLVMYNVPSTTFHGVCTAPGCRLLIVEDLDVASSNSEYHHFTEEEQNTLNALLA